MEFATISPREIDAYLFRSGYVIVDLREPRDFRKLHLKGAICIPYDQLEERARILKNQTLVLYCERGGTSLMAARELSEKGYRVMSMIGGIQAYKGKNSESYQQIKD
ncbi:MAG: rhodanese-like domain-containing protein [Lachnospiraceae bacterium]|jgi:rhodanese-related sulfurtransferase|nr:rhodanese-like domain-containing protein [Lachnospiraceae bacterium]